MDWIKRNLFFVLGAVVAVILLGVAGWYNWSGWSRNAKAREDLNAKYEELKRLNSLKPHPGDGRKVDNIARAREQQKQLQGVIRRAETRFAPVPAIPPGGTNVTGEEFASALRLTLDQLQRDATNQSVILSPNFSYSFTAQRQLVRFSPGSLPALAEQLGDVKHLAELLHAARVNTLDSLRRVRVSDDDRAGPQTDYLETLPQTNDLAVLVPYEISFRSFSAELAALLEGMAASPHGVIVRTINVEPATVTVFDPNQPAPVIYTPVATPEAALPAPRAAMPYGPSSRAMMERGAGEAFNERYGLGPRSAVPGRPPGWSAPNPGGWPAPAAGWPAAPTTTVPAAAPAAAKPGLQTVLNERQLNVTMLVRIVKLLPAKTTDAGRP